MALLKISFSIQVGFLASSWFRYYHFNTVQIQQELSLKTIKSWLANSAHQK